MSEIALKWKKRQTMQKDTWLQYLQKNNKSVHFLFVCFVEMKDTLSLSAAFWDDALTTTA